MALLASYMKNKEEGENLADYLAQKVFHGEEGESISPDAGDVAGFEEFMVRYKAGLPIERAAVESLR